MYSSARTSLISLTSYVTMERGRARMPERPTKSSLRESVYRSRSTSRNRMSAPVGSIVSSIMVLNTVVDHTLRADEGYYEQDRSSYGVRYSKKSDSDVWYAFLHPRNKSSDLILYVLGFLHAYRRKEDICDVYVHLVTDVHSYIHQKTIIKVHSILNARAFLNMDISHIRIRVCPLPCMT